MQILIIGKGAREHALAWHLQQSDKVTAIWVAPGNAGTEKTPKTQNLNITNHNVSRLTNFAKDHQIDFCFIDTEAGLNAGLVDALRTTGVTCFGPTEKAALLETSVSFVKSFMTQNQIPSPAYAVFHDQKAATIYLEKQNYPLIIKPENPQHVPAIYLCHSAEEAQKIAHSLLETDDNAIIVEAYYPGTPFNLTVLTDGTEALPLSTSMNFRHLKEQDLGPLTGGMGACSPALPISADNVNQIMTNIVKPTLTALNASDTPYFGFLHLCCISTDDNEFIVLDFNCRLGDPDTQVLLPRLEQNLIDLCMAAKNGLLHDIKKVTNDWVTFAVIAATEGYPACQQNNEPIQILSPNKDSQSELFHANTKINEQGALTTQAGRVFCATAWAKTPEEASQRAYRCLQTVSWPHMIYRKDITPALEKKLAGDH